MINKNYTNTHLFIICVLLAVIDLSVTIISRLNNHLLPVFVFDLISTTFIALINVVNLLLWYSTKILKS